MTIPSSASLAIIIDDDVDDEPLHQAVIQARIHTAVETTLKQQPELMHSPICIRFASDQSVQQLNAQWRDKDRTTDVLSFPMQDAPPLIPDLPLGDIVLAWPFVIREAERLQLTVMSHCLHLIVHGVLHLLGYDHQNDDEATCMQELERKIMQELSLHDPYPQ